MSHRVVYAKSQRHSVPIQAVYWGYSWSDRLTGPSRAQLIPSSWRITYKVKPFTWLSLLAGKRMDMYGYVDSGSTVDLSKFGRANFHHLSLGRGSPPCTLYIPFGDQTSTAKENAAPGIFQLATFDDHIL